MVKVFGFGLTQREKIASRTRSCTFTAMRVSINVVLFCALALCATAKLPASSKLQSFRVQREEAENAVPTVTAATAGTSECDAIRDRRLHS